MKYRKKPVVIEAVQWNGDTATADQIRAFAGANVGMTAFRDGNLIIRTLEGDMKASLGDWIIKGVAGELYPCRSDIFAATYEDAALPAPSQSGAGEAVPVAWQYEDATQYYLFKERIKMKAGWTNETPLYAAPPPAPSQSGAGEVVRTLRNACEFTLKALDTGRSEPLFAARDVLRNALDDTAAPPPSPDAESSRYGSEDAEFWHRQWVLSEAARIRTADERDKLQADAAAIRAALKPFADLCDKIEGLAAQSEPEFREPSNWMKVCSWDDLLAARNVLRALEANGGGND